MICNLRSDHSFDHLQVWTTWELWTLRHEKARFSDKKAPKTTQNEAKDGYCFIWEQDAAGSSPVTSTKTQKRRLASSSVFSSEFTDEEPLLFARKGSFCATLNKKISLSSAQKRVLSPVASTKLVLYAQKISPFRKIRADFLYIVFV